MTFLLDHLPDHLHPDHGHPLRSAVAAGPVAQSRAAHRAAPPTSGFTPGEAREFLNRVMGLELTEADVDALEDRTEGWIAGLQLAALSLRGIADRTRSPASFGRSPAATGSSIDYLADEVLARQSPKVRDFLLRTRPRPAQRPAVRRRHRWR